MVETNERPQLFWMSGSPYSWRAMLTLEAKGVSYESRLLEWSRGDLKTPEFLGLNPRARVPVLRHGATVIRESLAIMSYLDRRFPEPALFGATPEETARIWQAIMETVHYVDTALEHLIMPIFFGQDEPGWADRRTGMHAELAGLDKVLAGRTWLANSSMSAADIALYPTVRLLLRAADRAKPEHDLALRPLEAKYPALAAWMNRIEALPFYDRTYPPHWR
jgi:glutathione S-transferase